MRKKNSVGQKPVGMSNALTPDLQHKRLEYKKKRRLRAVLLVFVCAVVLLAAAALIVGFMSADVIHTVTVEAGDDMVPASAFFDGDVRAFFVSDSNIDTSKPGKYSLTVRNGIILHSVTLEVKDTVAPAAKPKHVKIRYGEKTVSAWDFVKSIKDETEVTARFKFPVDYTALGDSDVVVILTDLGSNETEYDCKFTVYPEEIIPSVTVEAGCESLSVRDFLSDGAPEYEGDCILTDVSGDFLNTVGSTNIEIMYCSVTYTVKLTVEDTTPPSARIKSQTTYIGKRIPAQSFTEEIFDSSSVTVSYAAEPDFDRAGRQVVEILLEDGGKNTRSYKVAMTVLPDTVKPEIFAENRTVYIGDNIRFSDGVTANDNCDGEIEVFVNADGFDRNTPGVYPVIFTATDKAGNTAEKEVMFTLTQKRAYLYTDEVMNTLFDSVYSKLNITPSMSEKEKIKTIYTYVRENISYNGTSEKSDWEQEAYRGLRSKAGDSFTFYSVSRKLLTMAGIENEAVRRVGSDSDHYWNIVIVDGKRYHFDACPHYKDFPIESYMLTEKQAREYSEKTNGYYTYK